MAEAPGGGMAAVASMQRYRQDHSGDDGGGGGGGGNVLDVGLDPQGLFNFMKNCGGIAAVIFRPLDTMFSGLEHGWGFNLGTLSQAMLSYISPPSVLSTINVPLPGAAVGVKGGGHGGGH